MKLVPALVPLEAWFWYMLFLDLLSAKPCLGFLIELIEQILHTIKFGEILWLKQCPSKGDKYVIDEELQHTDHLFLGVACFTFMNFV